MVGKTLAHYRVLEKIGTGGMGEVYRAEDLHLARDVAVKVLPMGMLADEQARRRFRKEAEALSKLNHTNIQTVHDFDTQEGIDFLVVEFVSGPTLADKLKAEALPEKEVASLGSQIAAALEEAHERGVVHRDMKPANIKVTSKGQVKVLDFGLAKLLKPFNETVATGSLTETHATAGTLRYMAPEQLRGEEVDHRSDIWAAGIVLYEMATGSHPFDAKLSTALTDAVLHKPAPPPGRLRPNLSPRLDDIILKCLEKDPENRYQSAKELGVDLRRLTAPTPVAVARRPAIAARRAFWGVAAIGVLLAASLALNVGQMRERLFGPGTQRIDSLAVLPLKNLMGDPEQDYFVEGMHEALVAELSKISALKVISRTSAMGYKTTDKAIPQIARELGVTGLVEGSVLREGARIRISVQLIHGPTDQHLWAENYQRELRGILALQSEVAREIARQIKVTLTPAEEMRLARARAVNPEAHELYLRGRYLWNKRGREGDLEKASEYFQQAIQKDPGYALAYASLADVYVVQPTWGFAPPSEGFPRARAAALKALELDGSLAEAYASLGFVKVQYDRDWKGAEEDFRRALELNPSYATAHHWYGLLLSFMGKHEDAIAELESAERLDPLSPVIGNNLGRVLWIARRYHRAVPQLQKTVEMHPDFSHAFIELGVTLALMGKHSEALAAAEKGSALPERVPIYGYIGLIYARTGRKAEARRVVKRLQELSRQQYIDPGAIAITYIGLGQAEEALTWLERAYEERGSFRILHLKVDPNLDTLRGHPRFQALLRRMNFPE